MKNQAPRKLVELEKTEEEMKANLLVKQPSPGWASETLPGFLQRRALQTPKETVCFETEAGRQRPVLWEELLARVRALAQGLLVLGLEPGQRVGILLPNGLDWDVAQFAILWAGGVVVGLDPHLPPRDTAELFQRADCRGLIIPHLKAIEGWPLGRLGGLSWIVARETAETHTEGVSRVLSWEKLYERTNEHELIEPTPRPQDPAAVIYTSGTTGQPKGLVYTHAQFTQARETLSLLFSEFGPSDRAISWLPMVNLFQRMVNLVAMNRGVPYYYVADPRTIMDWIPRLKPTLFVGVPRFYEKCHQGIMARLPFPIKTLLTHTIGFTQNVVHRQRTGGAISVAERLAFAVLNALLLFPLRRIWGGRLRMAVSGSAPCPVSVLNFFEGIGLPLLEAYGVSENIIPIAINRPSDYRLGSVGKPLAGQAVRIGDNGEVLVRGPGLCQTQSGELPPIDSDGFMSTKDLGRFDEEGFLYLTGRISDVIKTSNGRRIALPKLEMHFRDVPGVDQMVIVGHGRSCLVALASRSDTTTTIHDIAQQLVKKNWQVSPPERLAGILFLSEGFSIKRGEMTGNLKLRRMDIERNNADALKSMYEDIQQKGSDPEHLLVREI